MQSHDIKVLDYLYSYVERSALVALENNNTEKKQNRDKKLNNVHIHR